MSSNVEWIVTRQTSYEFFRVLLVVTAYDAAQRPAALKLAAAAGGTGASYYYRRRFAGSPATLCHRYKKE